jgi:hypothetical protein
MELTDVDNRSINAGSEPIWLSLSLLVALYFGLISLAHASSQDYIVQDDARLHIVWLQQFVDPGLFGDDLIAHYYQTIQAAGFKGVYWIAAQLGVEPLLLAKLLPTGLALLTTGFLFRLTLYLLPAPACGFCTTLLLNQNIWLKDDLISATPRAFVYPLLTAFLYALVQRSFWFTLSTIALMGLFYPQLVLVQLGILSVRWISPGAESRQHWLWLASVLVAMATILPFQHQVVQQFGSLLTATQMQQMPEFGLHGRRQYFGVDPLSFLFRGASGLRLPLFPPMLWLSLGLPLLWRRIQHSAQLPTLQLLSQSPPAWGNLSSINLLAQTLIASIGTFGLAHLLFPKLYLPSRYTFYSCRIVMALAAGIVLYFCLETGRRWLWRQQGWLNRIGVGLLGLFGAVVIGVPALPGLFLPVQGWVVGQYPQIYRFLATQPQQTLVASLSREVDNVPAFSQRSVLISRELALPYHPLFYDIMQQRSRDLLRAHYSPQLSDVQAVLQTYGIDYVLIDQQFATPDYLLQQDWLLHSSFQSIVLAVIEQLRQSTVPALTQVINRCQAVSEDNLILVKAACINGIKSN